MNEDFEDHYFKQMIYLQRTQFSASRRKRFLFLWHHIYRFPEFLKLYANVLNVAIAAYLLPANKTDEKNKRKFT